MTAIVGPQSTAAVRPQPNALFTVEQSGALQGAAGTLNVVTGTVTVTAGGVANLSASGDLHFTHQQSVAASTWTIVHNLGKQPSVSVTDTGGNLVLGAVSYPDANTCVLSFGAAFAGTAYCN